MKKEFKLKKLLSVWAIILLCGVAVTMTSCTLFEDEETAQTEDKDSKKDKKSKKKKKSKKDKKKKEVEPTAEPTAEPTEDPMADAHDEVCEFDVLTFTIPKSWYGLYYQDQQDDYIGFYQKASFDIEEGMGFIFGFDISQEIKTEYPGYRLVAYSDDYFYYVVTPTDVPYYLEDQEIADQYCDMAVSIDSIIYSLEIDDVNVCKRADDFIIPHSDKIRIPDYYCENLDKNQLWIARNELFARHGMSFENEYLRNYFTRKPWYTNENKKVTESDFNEIEKENLKIIQEAEAKYTKSEYPKKLSFNKEYKEDLDADGTKETLKVTAKQDPQYDSMYDVSIWINGKEHTMDDMNVGIDTLETGEYYLTQIRPYFGELQIVLLDWGPSYDLVSHYFDYEDDTLYYLDCLEGFTFKEYMGLDPFYCEDYVVTLNRLDLLTYTHYYGQVWYDRDAHRFEEINYNQREIEGAEEHIALKDIQAYANEITLDYVTIPAGETVYFVSENPATCRVKIRTKSGLEGYLQADQNGLSAEIGPCRATPDELFDNINFSD